MKTLSALCVVFVLVLSAAANAGTFYLEGIGSYGSYGDAKSMPSGMIGFGTAVSDYVNVYARGFYGGSSTVSTDALLIERKKEYSVMGLMGVVDCTYYFQTDLPVRIGLTASGGVGYANVEIKDDKTVEPSGSYKSLSDSAPILGGWAGVKVECTQRIALFVLGGYQRCVGFGSDLTDASVGGVNFLLGVTVTLGGVNSPIDRGY